MTFRPRAREIRPDRRRGGGPGRSARARPARACLDGPSRDIELLVDHRRTLVAQGTAIGNKLRWFLHELDPELAVASRRLCRLCRLCRLDHLAQALIQHHGMLAAIAAELVTDCRRLSERINSLESQIRRLVTARAPHLLAIPGCGVLKNACRQRRPTRPVIFHPDRGWQYTSQQFAALAREFGVRLSVGRTGQCWDNALAESFFATIKRELLGTAA